MKSIELRVPNAIENLTGTEQDRLLRTALRAAARQRAHELARERREALTHIRRYERKYGSMLAQFERKQLSGLDTAQAHEDYNDWFFWGTVLARAESAGAALLKLETVQ